MSQAYPEDEETEAAREGTASHEVGEKLIGWATRVIPATVSASARETFVGQPAENGVLVTDEMFDAAWEYANDVVREIRARPGAVHGTETRITAPHIHEQSFGTVDSWLYDRDKTELIVWDYKYGYGVVEAYENWQAINYLAGLLDMLGITGVSDPYLTVRIRIAQPRAFHRDGTIREWVISGAELRNYFNVLSNNAATALGPDAEIKTGEHCRYCSARHACPAALKAGLTMYETAMAPTPVELTPEAIGVQLSIIKRAKAQLEYLESGFEARLTSTIRSGQAVPGWSLRDGRGREKWAKPVSEVIALGEMMGIPLAKPTAVTPKQARDAGIDGALVEAYSERPNTGLKLVADDNKARRIFQ